MSLPDQPTTAPNDTILPPPPSVPTEPDLDIDVGKLSRLHRRWKPLTEIQTVPPSRYAFDAFIVLAFVSGARTAQFFTTPDCRVVPLALIAALIASWRRVTFASSIGLRIIYGHGFGFGFGEWVGSREGLAGKEGRDVEKGGELHGCCLSLGCGVDRVLEIGSGVDVDVRCLKMKERSRKEKIKAMF